MSKYTNAIRDTIIAAFNAGDQPTEAQFTNWITRIQEGIDEHDHGGAVAGDGLATLKRLTLAETTGGILITLQDTGATSVTDAITYLVFRGSSSNVGYLGFTSATTNNLTLWNYLDGNIELATHGVVRVTIDGDGLVGFKVAVPTALIDAEISDLGGYVAKLFNDGDSETCYGMRIQCGDDDASTAGTAYFHFFKDGAGGACGGTRCIAGVTAIYSSSDKALKQNIKPTSLAGLEKVLALQVKDYRRVNKKGGPPGPIQAGFVAQDVQEIMPTAVCRLDDGLLGLSDTMFIPMVVKAIQELAYKVSQLEAK